MVTVHGYKVKQRITQLFTDSFLANKIFYDKIIYYKVEMLVYYCKILYFMADYLCLSVISAIPKSFLNGYPLCYL